MNKPAPALTYESGLLGFDSEAEGMRITDPTLSSCGRFRRAPAGWGITDEQAKTIAAVNTPRTIVGELRTQLKKATIALAKAQIVRDYLEGHFNKLEEPITYFGQLHDCRDANYYGGFCDDDKAEAMQWAFGVDRADADPETPDGYMDFANEVQNDLDLWIRSHGLDLAICRVEAGDLFTALVYAAAEGLPIDLGL